MLAAVALGCASSASVSTATTQLPATVEPTPTSAIRSFTLEASLTPPVVTVGDTFKVQATGRGVGIPQYTLSIDRSPVCTLLYDGTLVRESHVEEARVIEWYSSASSAKWVLEALEPGEYTISIFVTGEVGTTTTGPFYFTGGSQNFSLTVNPAAQ